MGSQSSIEYTDVYPLSPPYPTPVEETTAMHFTQKDMRYRSFLQQLSVVWPLDISNLVSDYLSPPVVKDQIVSLDEKSEDFIGYCLRSTRCIGSTPSENIFPINHEFRSIKFELRNVVCFPILRYGNVCLYVDVLSCSPSAIRALITICQFQLRASGRNCAWLSRTRLMAQFIEFAYTRTDFVRDTHEHAPSCLKLGVIGTTPAACHIKLLVPGAPQLVSSLMFDIWHSESMKLSGGSLCSIKI